MRYHAIPVPYDEKGKGSPLPPLVKDMRLGSSNNNTHMSPTFCFVFDEPDCIIIPNKNV